MDVYRRLVNRDLPWVERSCTSKVPFVTRDEARSYLRSGHRAGSALAPYRCRFGDHWHLGHRRRRHPRPPGDSVAPARSPHRADDGPSWLSRDWWTDRRRRHLRPTTDERLWREAWAA